MGTLSNGKIDFNLWYFYEGGINYPNGGNLYHVDLLIPILVLPFRWILGGVFCLNALAFFI